MKLSNYPPICYVLLILVFTGILYGQVAGYPFQTSWDDHWVVMNVYTKAGLTAANLWRILSEFYNGQYAPINEIYYTILYHFFGYQPMAFHLGSLLIHMINIYLVFRFFSLLLVNARIMNKLDGERTALITCFIFAVHPLMIESVAWISASKILLYALFYLTGLIAYIKFLNGFEKKYLVFTFIAFLLSYLGKEQAVTFPLSLILIDFLFFKKKIPRCLWIQKIIFLLVSIVFGYITISSQSSYGQGLLSDNAQYPLYQRLAFCFYSIFEYLAKCLLPVKLSYVYPFPNRIGEPLPAGLLLYPVILFTVIAALWRYLKYRWFLLGVVFFLTHLITVVHIIPIARFVIVADRYVYLASPGLFFLIAYILHYLSRRFNRHRNTISIILVFYLLSLSGYSYKRIKIWHDSNSLKKEIRQIIQDRGIKLYPSGR